MAEQNWTILISDGKYGCLTRNYVLGICIYPQGSMPQPFQAIAKMCCHLSVIKGNKDACSVAGSLPPDHKFFQQSLLNNPVGTTGFRLV